MTDNPNIVRVAALIGDRARADILTALLAGEALTATELAQAAGVTKQTVSSHLAMLLGARLVAVESQGRHRYFRLADRDVGARRVAGNLRAWKHHERPPAELDGEGAPGAPEIGDRDGEDRVGHLRCCCGPAAVRDL